MGIFLSHDDLKLSMVILSRFIKLMKNEPTPKKQHPWLIDESKCFDAQEVVLLRKTVQNLKQKGVDQHRFRLIRDWFMVELGLHAGLRANEMATLQHANLLIEGPRSSIVVTGKGNKKRSVWISSGFKAICLEYLQIKEQFSLDVSQQAYVLPNLDDQKISKRSLQKFFKAIVREAGLHEHYSLHCLRHTYATFLLEASNHNYRFVQQQLGHASIRTTQVYATVLETEGRKAVEKLYKH